VSGPTLVTGASGFAGSHLFEQLAATRRVVGWSRSAPPPDLAGIGLWQRVDLLDRGQVRAAIDALRPAEIYHCAGVPQAFHDSAQPLAGNVLATHYLFDALRRGSRACRVLVPGSAMVYAASERPIDEAGALAPASPYALSKLAQEQLALRAGAEDGLDVVITRSFNHTGARQRPSFAAPGMARQIARIEAGQADPVMRVGNLAARRDLSDVRDTSRAYIALMERGRGGEIYNVATGTGRPIQAVLDCLLLRARVPIRVETDPALLRAADVPVLVGDPAKLHQATGWQPEISFDRMLDDLLTYWRATIGAR
jgi:GDP-4-dehydro-6-deoxy-D-mannose reductase